MHLVQEDIPVLCQLDLARAVNKHLERTTGTYDNTKSVVNPGVQLKRNLIPTKICTHDLRKASRCLYIDAERLGASNHLRIGVYEL